MKNYTPTFKKMTISLVTSFLFLGSNNLMHGFAQVTKTPTFGIEIPKLVAEDPIPMPEDYPEDLTTLYNDYMVARSYVVMDQETNKILAEREGTTPYPIASMSKVISVYLVYKAIDEGKIKMDTMVKIPDVIADNISSNPNLTNVGLVGGVEYSVKDLIYGMMFPSANDATSALMWEIYGDEETAVNAIKDQLAQWGITNIQFYQTSGVPNSELPESMWVPGSMSTSENYMSAADVAIMTKHVIEEYPEILEVSSAYDYVFKEGTEYEQVLTNPNLLLAGRQYGREKITGLKSGYTDDAGLCFVATGEENGRKFIAVAMGTFGEGQSSYWEIETLLDGLAKHPELYKQASLPAYTKPSYEEILALKEAEQSTEEAKKAGKKVTVNNYDNKRDNFLTNIMRNIFSVFN